MTTLALCGCRVSDAGYPPSEHNRGIWAALRVHYRANRACDRRARIEFQRLMALWGQTKLVTDG